ncbi:M15 family metallopeptidase [Cysteiniphilum sp. QT6929]|uniref:M15 family metallopeptidase n=1 Tax=Cysteiniphilum sp. QT6929 TaxID=2975055 RepID=UPI0024B34B52|nr:M15 family metallopeptidase [Cysteiniphilum sp. QT6929]WHN65950.1 D-alanyl-D-alanine carboxypeptidase family protein [Cysteiniphilum sp. QT6929]
MPNNHQKLESAYAILPIAFADNKKQPFFQECAESTLICGGKDVFNRDCYMQREAYHAWLKMQQSALQDGVNLMIVSAFRSYLYQANIILNKLNKGLLLEDILKVSALPGFSEHHTGCALDFTSDEESEVLTEGFEQTKAFKWLSKHAIKFHFSLSYPRDNTYGFIYEPWHWCYKTS